MTWDLTHFSLKALLRDVGAAIVLAIIFALLGIYDTNNLALLPRLSLWTSIMLIGTIIIFLTEPMVFRRLLKDSHPAIQIIAIAFTISLPITVFLVGVNTQFSFDRPPAYWVSQFVGVMIISLLISAGRYLIFQLAGILRSGSQPVDQTKAPAELFLERLPVRFRSSTLYAVSSEGHYLRVHTDRGSPLILMRISDAVRELTGAEGLQVHRSWWVAHAGVADTKRENGRRFLILKNDEIAPVSRAYIPALKAAKLDI